MQIYGAWHCGNDACTWGTLRDMTEFDSKNHWIIDRGDGSGLPSVNLIVLSFVNPLKLLNKTTDARNVNGVPIGMTPAVVNYFATRGIRVMLSIGGGTYAYDWDTALRQNPSLLGRTAAQLAHTLNVGIEIDYENNWRPNLTALESFISAYRNYVHTSGKRTRFDPTGANFPARLTIDLGEGNRYLIDLSRKATSNWLSITTPVLDYANSMVPTQQPTTLAAERNWQEHIDGRPLYHPPIPPLAPAKLAGSIYLATGRNPAPECTNFTSSLQKSTGGYLQTVAPNGAGATSGMLGLMFWAAESQSEQTARTTPPDTCEGGVGVGAKTYNIPIPMPPLRQK